MKRAAREVIKRDGMTRVLRQGRNAVRRSSFRCGVRASDCFRSNAAAAARIARSGVAADGWEGGRAGTLSPARAGFQRAWCAMLTVRPTSSPLRRTRSTSWRCTRRARPASWPGALAPLQRGVASTHFGEGAGLR